VLDCLQFVYLRRHRRHHHLEASSICTLVASIPLLRSSALLAYPRDHRAEDCDCYQPLRVRRVAAPAKLVHYLLDTLLRVEVDFALFFMPTYFAPSQA
jgi:hypothetical protein